jgi:hypothetical protein
MERARDSLYSKGVVIDTYEDQVVKRDIVHTKNEAENPP